METLEQTNAVMQPDRGSDLTPSADDAQYLLEIAFENQNDANYVVYANSEIEIQTTLLSKESRQAAFRGRGVGREGSTFAFVMSPFCAVLENTAMPNEKRVWAAIEAVHDSLKNLPRICEEVVQ
jgi:hypothetical protein